MENTTLILARRLTASPKTSLLTSWKIMDWKMDGKLSELLLPKVVFNGSKSNWQLPISGVPQQSILASTLSKFYKQCGWTSSYAPLPRLQTTPDCEKATIQVDINRLETRIAWDLRTINLKPCTWQNNPKQQYRQGSRWLESSSAERTWRKASWTRASSVSWQQRSSWAVSPSTQSAVPGMRLFHCCWHLEYCVQPWSP